MFPLIKLTTLVSILSILSPTSLSSVIPAAVIRRHTITYKDVPVVAPKIHRPIVYVPSSKLNLFVQFKTKSSKIHVKQEHKSRPGQVQHTVYEESPHYLKHEVKKPVIQTIREVIVPYRQVVQEIKPVVQEVKTVVATGVPHSSVYMNFGDKSVPNNFGYSMTTNHESDKHYDSADRPVSNQYSSAESKANSYDLSSIYGINPSVQQLTDLLPEPKPTEPVKDDHIVYEEPIVYGLTSDIRHTPGNNEVFGYVVNTVHDKPVQYSTHNNYDQEYAKSENHAQSGNYPQVYNYLDKPETNLIDQGYYSNVNNGHTSDGYYSHMNTVYQPFYNNEGYLNSIYSDGYSGDLATSDGSALQSESRTPLLSLYDVPMAKDATLATLAQLVSQLSYPYNYDNQSPVISYT